MASTYMLGGSDDDEQPWNSVVDRGKCFTSRPSSAPSSAVSTAEEYSVGEGVTGVRLGSGVGLGDDVGSTDDVGSEVGLGRLCGSHDASGSLDTAMLNT